MVELQLCPAIQMDTWHVRPPQLISAPEDFNGIPTTDKKVFTVKNGGTTVYKVNIHQLGDDSYEMWVYDKNGKFVKVSPTFADGDTWWFENNYIVQYFNLPSNPWATYDAARIQRWMITNVQNKDMFDKWCKFIGPKETDPRTTTVNQEEEEIGGKKVRIHQQSRNRFILIVAESVDEEEWISPVFRRDDLQAFEIYYKWYTGRFGEWFDTAGWTTNKWSKKGILYFSLFSPRLDSKLHIFQDKSSSPNKIFNFVL